MPKERLCTCKSEEERASGFFREGERGGGLGTIFKENPSPTNALFFKRNFKRSFKNWGFCLLARKLLKSAELWI